MHPSNLKTCIDRIVPAQYAHLALQAALSENPENRSQTAFEAAAIRSKLWRPGRTLRVAFLDGHISVQQKVEETAREWLQFANIELEFGKDPNAEIRISFHKPGAWSAVGTDALVKEYFPQSDPTMNFGWLSTMTTDSEYYVVLHEFGHALGMIHEHQSPSKGIAWNKPAVIEALSGPPNNWDLRTIERNVFERYSSTITQFTVFDPDSIMLYAFPKEWTLDKHEFGVNTQLSPIDKIFIAQRYPHQGYGR